MNICLRCEKDFPNKDQFCDQCGLKLVSKKSLQHTTTNAESGSKLSINWFLNLGFAFGIISLLGSFIFWLINTFFNNEKMSSIMIFLYSAFIFPIIPVISLLCNLISVWIIKKNRLSLKKKWTVIFGIFSSSLVLIFSLIFFLRILQ